MMPLTGAERQKRYIEKIKREQPEKYEEKRKKHLDNVKQRQNKIKNLSENEKIILRKKWREANKKRKNKKKDSLQKENEEKLRKRREIRAALYRSKLKKENNELREKVREAAYALLESEETEVKIFYISDKDITSIQNTIPDDLKPLPGTIHIHQIITQNCDGSIFYRDVSCYCESINRGLCKCFDLKEHQLIRKGKPVAKKRSANNPEKGKKSGKRKRDEDSTDTELESDITYAETSESEGKIISEVSSDDEDKCTQVDNINKKLKTEQENKENMYRKKTKTEEKKETITRNEIKQHEFFESNRILVTSSNTNVKILENIEVVTVLDEKTGRFISKIKKNEVPKIGNFILAKFYTKSSKKIYRYVCLIENIHENSIVVKGLKSKKSKNIFKIVDDDISIIDLKDIIEFLPHPTKENDYYIFREAIDVSEA
ncbi:hypothetical protein ACJJTC_002405 [Scirpophaga incertulas]